MSSVRQRHRMPRGLAQPCRRGQRGGQQLQQCADSDPAVVEELGGGVDEGEGAAQPPEGQREGGGSEGVTAGASLGEQGRACCRASPTELGDLNRALLRTMPRAPLPHTLCSAGAS